MIKLIHTLRGHVPFKYAGRTYWWRPSRYVERSFDFVRFGLIGRIRYSRTRGVWCAHIPRPHPMLGYQPDKLLGSDPNMEKAMNLVEDFIMNKVSNLDGFVSEFSRIRAVKNRERV